MWEGAKKNNLVSIDRLPLQLSPTYPRQSTTGAAIMGRITTFLFGVIIGGAAVFGSLKYHVVRAEDGVHLVPKTSSSFEEIYVDVREFGPTDWTEHTDLAIAMVKADKEHLIGDTTANSIRQSVHNVLGGLNGGQP